MNDAQRGAGEEHEVGVGSRAADVRDARFVAARVAQGRHQKLGVDHAVGYGLRGEILRGLRGEGARGAIAMGIAGRKEDHSVTVGHE